MHQITKKSVDGKKIKHNRKITILSSLYSESQLKEVEFGLIFQPKNSVKRVIIPIICTVSLNVITKTRLYVHKEGNRKFCHLLI